VNEKLEAAVKARPYSPFPYSTAGAFYMGTGHLEEAEACYRKALALAPDSAAYNFRLFTILQAGGRTEDAKKYLCRACELFPHNPRYRTAYDAFMTR
ncbi:MAG: tetratricopeptide repeat protein, partial [Victivallales bacterium]|nr:tetratricopeptide repeat protein [Victivallales bacterium]